MSARSFHYQRRAAVLMRVNAVWVTYRRVTRLDGAYPAANPPRITGSLVAAGAQIAGAATLAIRAERLQGRLIPGDRLGVGGTTYAVASPVTDAGANTIAVPISPALAAPVADGAAVTATWSADSRIPSRRQDFGLRLIDGEMIQRGDQRFTVAHNDLAAEPQPQDQIILEDGKILVVVGAIPARMDGDPITWDIQAR